MSKKCPKCGSKDTNIAYYPAPTDHMATCYGCGYADLLERFPEQSIFDCLTASPEVLAERFVYKLRCMGVNRSSYICWKSTIIYDADFSTREEAIAATLERLKEVAG